MTGRIRARTLRAVAWCALLVCTAAPPDAAAGRTDRLPEPVAEALREAKVPVEAVGIYVQETGSRKPLLAFGAERALNPASVMKLVTTFAALEVLGPAYTWKTRVSADGPLRQGVLEGNLYIRGSGDPKLTLERFWLLLRNLRARGIRHISGDVVLDRSRFAVGPFDPGAFDGEPFRPYNAGPDALLVNFSTTFVHVVPGGSGAPIHVFLEPPVRAIAVENRLWPSDGPCRTWDVRGALRIESNWTDARLQLTGPMPESCGEMTENVSVLDGRRFTEEVFRLLWRELGGTVDGTIREGTAPEGARVIAESVSPSLAEIVRDVNKFSNNVMARQLLLTIAAETMGQPATPESGWRALRAWLGTRGLDFPELVVENGAGLSRIERISARHLAELLMEAHRSPLVAEFISSLPLAAVDGTLKTRLQDSPVAGQAHLKTGYLDDVRAIAGYVHNGNGQRLVVVFIMNHPNAKYARPVQEVLLGWLREQAADKRR